MQKFSDVLLTLDDASHVQRIELFNSDASLAGVIENKPCLLYTSPSPRD